MKTKKVRPILVDSNKWQPLVYSTNKYGGLFKSEHYSPMKEMGDSYKELILISLVTCKDIEYRTKYYNSASKKIEICQSLSELNDFCFKVIATQEQIPLEYINQFIKEYNENDVKDIEIEMDCKGIVQPMDEVIGINHSYSIPKLTNGFVNIVKNSTNIEKHKHYTDKKEQITYTEEEVYKMCKTSFEMHMTNEYSDDELIEIFKVWFNENKKK